MIATSFDIIGRKRNNPVAAADIKDFELQPRGTINAEEVLVNPCITLYSLDFDQGQAVFVETPPDVNLSQVPFFYQAQYENALRVLTLPFETMIALAGSVTVDSENLILIYSVGRAGSTLASRIFAQVAGVINISEPDVLTLLVAARFMQPDKHDIIKVLLDASIRLLCKTPAQTAWVIKGRSWVIELGDWLHELYPQTKNLYLYRDAETWIKSMLGIFMDDVERTPDQHCQFEIETRGWMQLVTPAIARYDANQHLSASGLCALMWLSNIEQYTELHQAGVRMLAIRYSGWRQDALQTALFMLEYCGCHPTDLAAIKETLQKDSQAGTSLAWEARHKKAMGTQFFDLVELNKHLQAHAYIRTANFEVPSTLKL
jgi:hypothetical protein